MIINEYRLGSLNNPKLKGPRDIRVLFRGGGLFVFIITPQEKF